MCHFTFTLNVLTALTLSSLSQLLAFADKWSHLGICGTSSVHHCGEEYIAFGISNFVV